MADLYFLPAPPLLGIDTAGSDDFGNHINNHLHGKAGTKSEADFAGSIDLGG
jgi:hypothetical protein